MWKFDVDAEGKITLLWSGRYDGVKVNAVVSKHNKHWDVAVMHPWTGSVCERIPMVYSLKSALELAEQAAKNTSSFPIPEEH